MSTLIKSKGHSALKVFAIIFSVLIVLSVSLYFFAVTHTQVIVGFIQSCVYGDAIVLDDAPLDYENFTLNGKILIGNYVKGSIFLSDDEISRYNNIFHLTSEYPPTFLLGSEYRHDMNLMHEHLNELNVMNELVDPYAEHGETKPHCFIANERVDPIAKDAFDRLITFLNSKIE